MKNRGHPIFAFMLILAVLLTGYASAAGPQVGSRSLQQCSDHVRDGSFEAGYWQEWTPTGGAWMQDYMAHHGAWSAVLGGDNNHSDSFYQDIDLPSGATSATLSFWWQIYTEEGGIGTPIANDFFSAIVQDHQGTQYVVESLSNTSNVDAWYQTTVDLDPAEFTTLYGHTTRLIFQATTDSADFTSFYVDQVSLTVCGAPSPTATPASTPTPTAACPADPYENNDSFASAWVMTPGVDYDAYICLSGDVDWFSFSADTGQIIDATLVGPEGDLPADYDLHLYDPSGGHLVSSSNGGGTTETISHQAAVAGEYRLLVDGYDGAWSGVSAYRLHVALSADATATPTPTPSVYCPPDEYESNDSFGTAYPLNLDADHTGYICPSGDVDWFWLYLSPGDVLTAHLSGLEGPLPADYDLHLYDPSGGHLISSSSGGSEPETIIYEAAVAGDYRLLVDGFQSAWSEFSPYLLHVTKEAPPSPTPSDTPFMTPTATATATSTSTPSCPADAYEDNPDRFNPAAVPLPFLEDPLYLCPSDADYYAANVPAGKQLWIDLSYDSADGQLALGLYGSSGLNMQYVTGSEDYKQITQVIQAPDAYVVGVLHDGDQGSTVPYALSIRTTDLPTATPTRTQTATTTPTPTPTRNQVDVSIDQMEATQGLQNLANDISLVAGKGTYLRVYVSADRLSWIGVGDVEATLNGAPLSPASVPLSMVKRSRLRGNAEIRGNTGYTMNCFLPRSWVAQPGLLALTAKVAPQGADDLDPSDNESTLSIQVEASPQMHIQAVQVRDGGFLGWGAKGPSYADYKDIHYLTQQLYPVAKVQLHPHKRSIPWLTGPLTLVALMNVDMLDRDPGPNTVIMGMVRTEAYSPLADGMGLPSRHVWVEIKSRADQIAAHEAGHGFGMWHVKACGEHWPFESYPYPADQISWGGWLDYWGADLRSYPPKMLPGADWADIMTYCFGKHWISPHTYNKLRGTLRGSMTSSLATADLFRTVRPLAGTEYLMALGTVAADGSTADLVSTLRVDGDTIDPEAKTSPDGDYWLRLLGSSSQVLAEVSFGASDGNHQEGAIPFSVLIPWDEATTRVVVGHGSNELTSEPVSENAPEVSFNPVGDVVTDTLECSWTATDADGDDLVAALLFSADDGATWEPVAVGIEGTQYDPDTQMWPETGSARLRVLVSDGLNTSEAVSNLFAVPERPPVVYITAPDDGMLVLPEDPVFLRGTGYDAEDGPLGEEAYVWSSDVDGPLGQGEEAVVDWLSEGWHTITLTATDSDEHVATDSIRVLVGYASYLPLILR